MKEKSPICNQSEAQSFSLFDWCILVGLPLIVLIVEWKILAWVLDNNLVSAFSIWAWAIFAFYWAIVGWRFELYTKWSFRPAQVAWTVSFSLCLWLILMPVFFEGLKRYDGYFWLGVYLLWIWILTAILIGIVRLSTKIRPIFAAFLECVKAKREKNKD